MLDRKLCPRGEGMKAERSLGATEKTRGKGSALGTSARFTRGDLDRTRQCRGLPSDTRYGGRTRAGNGGSSTASGYLCTTCLCATANRPNRRAGDGTMRGRVKENAGTSEERKSGLMIHFATDVARVQCGTY
ncbi:hypothetical protein BD311DRAFT_764434 [Dichomitus squalens]|uniref:Uncharacterized protein n=1 Tax=Dichomitus squalens TaxID=114155 RepID=A0A4Q9PSE2_9APHY|nr:hypothetical protein BD311DRAFT_764434 [Dichomitus squalens]TBU57321.1 hypothetical protein BD310DRAFT_929457 [Dichomitus squalens]